MTIVINLQSNSSYINLFKDFFIELAKSDVNIQFIFLSPFSIGNLPKNCSVEIVRKSPSSKIAQQYWNNYKIPAFLKKHKATHYFSSNGIIVNSKNITQYIFLSLPLIANKKTILPAALSKYYGLAAQSKIATAYKIFTPSIQEKNKFVEQLSIPKNKVAVFPIIIGQPYHTLFWEKQEEVKSKYTGGKDYFLANYTTITPAKFVTLLKAFTQFKKWQKSSLQLLFYSPNVSLEIEELLSSYKYKNDVQLIFNLPETEYAQILASAYAFIFDSTENYLPLQLLQAMQCQIPCIVSTELNVIFTDNVAFADFEDVKSIAAQLILLYKDEDYRNKFVQNGFQFITSLNTENKINSGSLEILN